jgi:hypothetical protein
VLIPSRRSEDLFAGWWQLIAALGAVPRALVWDGEGAIGRWRSGRIELTGECQAFRGTLAAKVIVCRPADPEAKGLIGRSHDYLERSFLPGRASRVPSKSSAPQFVPIAEVELPSRCHPDGAKGSSSSPDVQSLLSSSRFQTALFAS